MTRHPNHIKRRASGAAALIAAAVLGIAACNNTDPTAPADSTVTVSANPSTVVVPAGGQGTTELTATLRSKSGAREPGQEMTFSTTSGILDPAAETTILTDNNGQAMSKLTLTSNSPPTVTARSGSITATVQVLTTSAALSQFLLDIQPSDLTTCTDQLTMTAIVEDPNGDPVPGVRVIFAEETPAVLTGSFSPSSQRDTDATGTAVVTWKPSQATCDLKCTMAGNDPNTMGNCGTLQFTASDLTGNFESQAFPIPDNIP